MPTPLEIIERSLERIRRVLDEGDEMGRNGGQQKKSREEAIRAWQANHGYNVEALEQKRRGKKLLAEEELLRVVRKCYEYGIEIQGKSLEELQYIVDNKLI